MNLVFGYVISCIYLLFDAIPLNVPMKDKNVVLGCLIFIILKEKMWCLQLNVDCDMHEF